jgi:hypothetical protein
VIRVFDGGHGPCGKRIDCLKMHGTGLDQQGLSCVDIGTGSMIF